ncbi:hypothetical protein MPSEU_000003600 [Mayamaea pseudoterrestris]|nr:hypothetical protein MPSEU_000003600 [Mayamaea pseudoterrestris]
MTFFESALASIVNIITCLHEVFRTFIAKHELLEDCLLCAHHSCHYPMPDFWRRSNAPPSLFHSSRRPARSLSPQSDAAASQSLRVANRFSLSEYPFTVNGRRLPVRGE